MPVSFQSRTYSFRRRLQFFQKFKKMSKKGATNGVPVAKKVCSLPVPVVVEPDVVETDAKLTNVFELLAKSPDDLIVIDNFLPQHTAENALQAIQNVPQASWHVATNSPQDYSAAVHHYLVGDGSIGAEYNDDIENVLSTVGSTALPDADQDMVRLQLGRYESGDGIAPHDDIAVQELDFAPTSNRQPVTATRRIALIYYLTKDWTEDMGGAFVDMNEVDQNHSRQKKQKWTAHVPRFNRVVAFNVPRLHSVEPVAAVKRPRYSVFGWLYEELPGKGKGKGRAKKNKNNKFY